MSAAVAVPPLPSASDALDTPVVGEELGWPVNFEERFQLGRLLGQGAYALVYEGYDGELGSTCAVKVLGKERKNCSRRRTLRRLQREAVVLSRCSHLPNIARLQAVYEKESYVYLVLECIKGGDLEQLMRAHGPLCEAEAACLIYECLKVLRACHMDGVVHGDVKPANFVLEQEYGMKDLTYVRRQEASILKAVDFGCSQVLCPGYGLLTKRTGTPVYMAPDVFNKSYATPADLWSLGMLLYYMLCGRLPFWPSVAACRACKLEEVMAAVCGAPIPMNYGPWLHLSPDCLDLVTRLLQRNPILRLTAEEAMEHSWFYRFSR